MKNRKIFNEYCRKKNIRQEQKRIDCLYRVFDDSGYLPPCTDEEYNEVMDKYDETSKKLKKKLYGSFIIIAVLTIAILSI